MRGVWQLAILSTVLLIVVVGIPAMVWGPGYLRYRQEMRVRAEGLPATAVVLGLEDTGNRFNDVPEMLIRLEVHAEGRPPWRAEIRRVLTFADAPAFAPGVRFAVRYDPERPDLVAVAP